MAQPHHGRKRYWLRGAAIAVLLQVSVMAFLYFFYGEIVFSCAISTNHDYCRWAPEWISYAVFAYVNPFLALGFHNVASRWSIWHFLSIYLSLSFLIGAAVGALYGKVVRRSPRSRISEVNGHNKVTQ